MKKRIYRIIAVIMMMSLLTACSTNKEEEAQDTKAEQELTKITFILDWTPNTNHTGLYVAQEKGYFEEAGLEVEIVQPPEDGVEVLVGT